MALFTVDSSKYACVKENAVAQYCEMPTLLALIGDLSNSGPILDAGCGVGTNTILLCTKCGAQDVTAIDCDQNMVETTKTAVDEMKLVSNIIIAIVLYFSLMLKYMFHKWTSLQCPT